MATPKPHIKLNTQRQTEGKFTFRYANRFPGITDDDDIPVPKDHTQMARQFRSSLTRFEYQISLYMEGTKFYDKIKSILHQL